MKYVFAYSIYFSVALDQWPSFQTAKRQYVGYKRVHISMEFLIFQRRDLFYVTNKVRKRNEKYENITIYSNIHICLTNIYGPSLEDLESLHIYL